MRDQIAPDPFVVLDDAFCAQMGTVRHSVAVGSHHENPLGAEFVEIRLELSLEERVVELLCDDAVAGLSVQRTQDLPSPRQVSGSSPLVGSGCRDVS